jgi:hypothetical protein
MGESNESCIALEGGWLLAGCWLAGPRSKESLAWLACFWLLLSLLLAGWLHCAFSFGLLGCLAGCLCLLHVSYSCFLLQVLDDMAGGAVRYKIGDRDNSEMCLELERRWALLFASGWLPCAFSFWLQGYWAGCLCLLSYFLLLLLLPLASLLLGGRWRVAGGGCSEWF